MYIVYGEESGEIMEFKTKRDAEAWVKEVKRFDAENGLEGENWTITKE